ncbi:hypothetical protein B0H50_10579 [Hallerella porci]|uniref:MotA/TolQ/ExbB proton channel domain-containing protein n=2 Tax=Fibrobacteraceae TaxID=204431 RepID=A0ABX5LM82_9BACT|nr:hypothetical protein B0H50_10579 [Hallerella porci]
MVSLIGAAILALGAFYFGAPLFGWVIMVAIFVIYLMSAMQIFSSVRTADAERNLLKKSAEACDAGNEIIAEELPAGIFQDRVQFLKRFASRHIALSAQDLPMLKSMWASKEELPIKSHSGVVVLLGLMGTFFGLMLSINAAGGAIDSNATSETTLGIIQNIFASMKGIFGSSLCGLFAALILNAIYATYESDHEKLIAELDAFTLFYLIPKTVSEKDEATVEIRKLIDTVKASDAARAADFRGMIEASKSAEISRTESLAQSIAGLQSAEEKTLTNLSNAQQQNLLELQKMFADGILKAGEKAVADLENAQKVALDSMQTAVQKLAADFVSVQKNAAEGISESGKNATAELRDSLSQVTAGLSEEMQKLSTSVRSIESGVVEGLEKEISNLSASVADSISLHLDKQISNSSEQWNALMESLKTSTEQVAAAEQKGLEVLRSVAEEVASKANDSTVGLSNTVTGEIENLSQKVQSSFAELAKSSELLVSSQRELIAGIENRVVKENESTEALGSGITEAAKLMRVNQSEFAANLEMFGKGIEAVLSKLSGDVPERENEQNFMDQLNTALQSFQERSGEVLLENALKTQEILLEILDQVQKTPKKAE